MPVITGANRAGRLRFPWHPAGGPGHLAVPPSQTEASAQPFSFLQSCMPSKVPFEEMGFFLSRLLTQGLMGLRRWPLGSDQSSRG